jgi:hypothetical protein
MQQRPLHGLPEFGQAAAASESFNNDYDDSNEFKLSLDLAYGQNRLFYQRWSDAQSHDDDPTTSSSSNWNDSLYGRSRRHSHIFPGTQARDLALADPTSFDANLYTLSSP